MPGDIHIRIGSAWHADVVETSARKLEANRQTMIGENTGMKAAANGTPLFAESRPRAGFFLFAVVHGPANIAIPTVKRPLRVTLAQKPVGILVR